MKKFKELPPTKKYAIGSVHENVNGEFQILERWLGEDGFVMLKYEYTDSGIVEENREVNVASALAKFRKKKELEDSKTSAGEIGEVWRELQNISETLRLLTIQQATILQKLERLESR